MIEFMAESEGNVVGIPATFTLMYADYENVLIPGLEWRFDAHVEPRVPFHMDEPFDDWELPPPRTTRRLVSVKEPNDGLMSTTCGTPII